MMIDKEEWLIIKSLTMFKIMILFVLVSLHMKLKSGFHPGLQKLSMILIFCVHGSQRANMKKCYGDQLKNLTGIGLIMLPELRSDAF